jgi:hypothetical protein
VLDEDCGTNCGTRAGGQVLEALSLSAWCRVFGLLKALHNRKRPSGEEGRFWGYYREERY